MDTLSAAIAATLRAELSARKITYREFAQATGIPLRTLVRYMTGERPAPLETLVRCAAALYLSMSQIFQLAEARIEMDKS